MKPLTPAQEFAAHFWAESERRGGHTVQEFLRFQTLLAELEELEQDSRDPAGVPVNVISPEVEPDSLWARLFRRSPG